MSKSAKTITPQQRDELAALLVKAAEHKKAIDNIEMAACAITDQEYCMGTRTADYVYNGTYDDVEATLHEYSVEKLLSELRIGVPAT